jgi:chemotaxis protein CheD
MTELAIVKVGMADLNVAADGAVLKTSGLGSCVGLTLFDSQRHAAGMAHIMLPSSEIAREGMINVAKYANTAVNELLEQVLRLGADRRRLVAKMAGGAQMFAFTGASDSLRIGPRNVESAKRELERLGIPLVAEDTGGHHGRTVELDSRSGVFSIRSVQYGVKEI